LGDEALLRLASRLLDAARHAAPAAPTPAAVPPRPSDAGGIGEVPSQIELCRYCFGSREYWLLQHNTAFLGWTESTAERTSPSGLKVWPACPALCRFLCGPDAPHLAGRRCLELGAGVGVAAVVLASLGASVTVTDANALCLRIARVNALLNGVEQSCSFEPLEFGEEDSIRFHSKCGTFELIFGADVLYVDRAAPLLLETAVLLLAPAGSCYLCVVGRHKHLTVALRSAAREAGFVWEAPRPLSLEEEELRPGCDRIAEAELFRLTRRGAWLLDAMD